MAILISYHFVLYYPINFYNTNGLVKKRSTLGSLVGTWSLPVKVHPEKTAIKKKTRNDNALHHASVELRADPGHAYHQVHLRS
jgi:hypothetical protein